MGWTARAYQGACTSHDAITMGLGKDAASRIVCATEYDRVIYAAVRSLDDQRIFGLVLLTILADGVLYTKPMTEDMGPAEDECPAHILDLLTRPGNANGWDWRRRCRDRFAAKRRAV